jgi:FkbM family methyltransferase
LRAYTARLRPGAVVFDIGANVGAHTLHFARLVAPTGRVYAFEPTDYAFGKLRANVALNPDLAALVVATQAFLVERSSDQVPAAVYSSWPVAGQPTDLHAEHRGALKTTARATALTADDFCTAHGVSRLDFVKIDVDGHELTVMRGFQTSLRRFRPDILIELAPYLYEGENAAAFDAFVGLLTELKYQFTDARTGRAIPADPARLRRSIAPGASINALLLSPRTAA